MANYLPSDITMVNTEFEFGRRNLFTKFTDRKIVLTA